MSTFTPPATSSVPPTSFEPHPGNRLMRYFRARPEGVNVYLYREGSTTANYLASLAVPLPRVSETDPVTLYDSSGVATTNGWDDLETIFWGGTVAVEVTDTQATVLTDAGYTVAP